MRTGKGQQHKRMCSGLGYRHALRENSPKRAGKHTKHAHKTTMHNIANMPKYRTPREWVRDAQVCASMPMVGTQGRA